MRVRTSKVSKDVFAVLPDGKAAFASRPALSRGRQHQEAPSKTRGAFERDRDRIIHSKAFRRLKFKTQVFVYHEGDHYRSRLSHSIEVAQVARSLSRLLKIDEDLAESCALAHDLGHTPFAHVGEDALKECMASYGGFDHNDQTLRIVTQLERKYPDFDGLNLSWETLEGLVKHNGPVAIKGKGAQVRVTLDALRREMDLDLSTHASLEAQVAAIADDIAYNSHDIDDGLTAQFFTLEDLGADVAWVGDIIKAKRRAYPGIATDILEHEVVREVMGTYVADVLGETRRRIEESGARTPDDIRAAGRQIADMSPAMRKKDRALRDFLWSRFYRHHEVNRMRLKVFRVVQDLFRTFIEHKRCLPPEWLARSQAVPKGWKSDMWHARCVADYIASMTDRLALLEHDDLFNPHRVKP